MIPASCAVTRASPFGSSRRRRAVSEAIRTEPRAIARRREAGLSPTSTMRTSPASLRWLSSAIQEMLVPCRLGDAIERRQLQVEPVVHVVAAHVCPNRLEPSLPLRGLERERLVDRLSLTVDVERVHCERPVAEL